MEAERYPDQSIPEIWFEPADPRRLGVLLRRAILAILVVLTAGATALTLALGSRIAANERFEDRQLANTLAASDPGVRADLAAAAGREAMVLEQPVRVDGQLDFPLTVIVAREVPTPTRLAWLRTQASRVSDDTGEWFTSRSDTNEVWWHTTARISPDQRLVISRPESQALATVNRLRLLVAGLVGLTAAGLLGLWFVLRGRVEASTNTLMEAVEDLRVRGEIRATTRSQLDAVPERPIELKRLAKAVQEIEVEIRGAFLEIDSLLQGAEALGGSLEVDAVLSGSLEHLEQLLGVERSAIVKLDHRREVSTVLALRGHDDAFGEALARQPYDPWLPSVRASHERTPVQISDTWSDFVAETLRDRSRQFGYRSILAVPLPPVLESPTVLLLHKAEPYTYSHYEVELSVSFAAIAAAALRNAELFAQTDQSLREQTSRLSAIVESVDDGLLVESVDGRLIYANSPLINMVDSEAEPVALDEGHIRSWDLLARIAERATVPLEAMEALDQVRLQGDAWCDVELAADHGPQTWQVRSFGVTNALNEVIGSGLVWTDVTRDRELDRMKSGLLATVSHEFRTPLALIKGYATTLLADDVQWGEAERYEFLELVASEADRLSTLVQRLLDMRRIDAGLVDLQTVPIELESVIEAAVGGVGPDSSRILVEEIPERVILADETRIVTALRNLLDNACKYSPSDQTVTVTFEATNQPSEVTIKVCDRGPGVAQQDRDSLFDMFVRGESGLDAVHAGTGLGLAIARGFVSAHGGRLWMQDRDGGGSVFAMSLPVITDESDIAVGLAPAVL
jgi:signal transduction histidine kinase